MYAYKATVFRIPETGQSTVELETTVFVHTHSAMPMVDAALQAGAALPDTTINPHELTVGLQLLYAPTAFPPGVYR